MDMGLRLVVVADTPRLMIRTPLKRADSLVGGAGHLLAAKAVLFLRMPGERKMQNRVVGFPAGLFDAGLFLSAGA